MKRLRHKLGVWLLWPDLMSAKLLANKGMHEGIKARSTGTYDYHKGRFDAYNSLVYDPDWAAQRKGDLYAS